MNIKLITKAMHTLSLLSEDDVQMVMKLRGLSEDERQMLMLVLEPGVKPSKKSSKKSVGKGGGGTKSRHASSLGQQIQKRQRRTTADESDDDNRFDGAGAQAARAEFLGERCTVLRGDLGGTTCGLLPDHNVHHLESVRGYHPFVSTAQAVESSLDQVTSETAKAAVGDAHHAGG